MRRPLHRQEKQPHVRQHAIPIRDAVRAPHPEAASRAGHRDAHTHTSTAAGVVPRCQVETEDPARGPQSPIPVDSARGAPSPARGPNPGTIIIIVLVIIQVIDPRSRPVAPTSHGTTHRPRAGGAGSEGARPTPAVCRSCLNRRVTELACCQWKGTLAARPGILVVSCSPSESWVLS